MPVPEFRAIRDPDRGVRRFERVSVETTVDQPELVPELQRRAAHELELASQLSSQGSERSARETDSGAWFSWLGGGSREYGSARLLLGEYGMGSYEVLEVGASVGPYVLGPRIGLGGMGVVYEARQPDGSAVALKVLHREHAADYRAVRRFRGEAMAGRLVAHPNVVSVISHGESDGVPFLVMERVRGERLGELIDRKGPLPPRRAVAIVCQILAGLDAMHAIGLVHADIKCDNVLVDGSASGDHVTLVDLGLARVRFSAHDSDGVDDDMISGTPDYMAPEVIRGAGSSHLADLYAVGVILYELITGSTPFGGGSALDILQRHLHEDVVPPALRCPDLTLPPVLERVVMRALRKEPARRFASAAAFSAALTNAARCLGSVPACRATRFSTQAPTLGWRCRAAAGTPRVPSH